VSPDTEEYLVLQEEYCRSYNIDRSKANEQNSLLLSLIDAGIRNDALIAVSEAYADINENIEYWRSLWHLSNDSIEFKVKNPREKAFLDLFLYQLLVEGISSKLIQLIAFLLMEKDHDIYDSEKREFVKKYAHLSQISLHVKIQFIRKHGFILLTDFVDRNLRNSIAHMNVIVKEDGTIVNKKTKQSVTNLDLKMNQLGSIHAMAINVINLALERIGAIEKQT